MICKKCMTQYVDEHSCKIQVGDYVKFNPNADVACQRLLSTHYPDAYQVVDIIPKPDIDIVQIQIEKGESWYYSDRLIKVS